MTLSDWIEAGRRRGKYASKSLVRRWTREARGHVPVIDRARNFAITEDLQEIGARVDLWNASARPR